MSRIIKFKAKSLVNIPDNGNIIIAKGEWVYGGLVYDCNRVWIDTEYYGQILVDKNTVSEFTGIYDKNGDEIYEWDIIIDSFYDKKAKVVFIEGAFWLDYIIDFNKYETIHKRYQLMANYDNKTVLEKIGNIFDNEDLLQ